MLGNIKRPAGKPRSEHYSYMDEAARVRTHRHCAHGKTRRVDAPMALKASVNGSNVIEAQVRTILRTIGSSDSRTPRRGHFCADEVAGMYQFDRQRFANHHRARRNRRVEGGRCGEVAVRAEHHAGRRILQSKAGSGETNCRKPIAFTMPQRPGLQP